MQYVSGEVLTRTWTASNSPYIVTGETTVPVGETLTIAPGVTVKFDNNTRIVCYGVLKAIGTPEGQITFTSTQAAPSKGSWNSLSFIGNFSVGSSLEYCNVSFAKYGVYLTAEAQASIVNSSITRNTFGIFSDKSSFLMDTTLVSSNCVAATDPAIYIIRYPTTRSYTTIRNCSISSNEGIGLNISTSSLSSVDNNWIFGNKTYGVAIGSTLFVRLTSNNIVNNGNGSGSDRSGVCLNTANNALLRGNYIAGNNPYGIYSSGSQRVVMYCNNFVGNIGYGVYVPASSALICIDASNNWWGSASGPSGEAGGSGDKVSKYVIYSDWLSKPGANFPPSPTGINFKANKLYNSPLTRNPGWLDRVFIDLQATDASPESINWATVALQSDSDPTGINFDIIESGTTNRFRGDARVYSSSSTLLKLIKAIDGDILTASTTDGAYFNSTTVSKIASWEEVNSPERISNSLNLKLYNGYTLYINPGVTVEFGGDSALSCGFYWGPPLGSTSNAYLLALGTREKRITFTSSNPNPQPGCWGDGYGGIQLNGAMVDIHKAFRFCDIRYANEGVKLNFAENVFEPILFEYCLIEKNSAGFSTSYSYGEGPLFKIIGSTIRNNGIGFYCPAGASFMAKYNNIYGNATAGVLSPVKAYATNNYWGGDASGPYSAAGNLDPNTSGLGNSVANLVIYRPWLTSPVSDIAPSSVSSIRIFRNKYTDDITSRRGIGVLENLYISVEASDDPSSEAYNYFPIYVSSEAMPGGFYFPMLQQNKNGNIYNGSFRISATVGTAYRSYDEIVGFCFANPGNSVRISALANSVAIPVVNESTWEVSDNPQLLYRTMALPTNSRLKVEPGVTVEAILARLNIYGTLEVNGKSDNPVIFRSGQLSKGYSDWTGIHLVDSDLSSLRYAKIENADDTFSSGSAASLLRSDASFYGCTFRYNRGQAINSNTSIPRIENCTITNTSVGSSILPAIALNAGGGIIKNNTIRNNATHGIYTNGATNLEIIGNTIRDNVYQSQSYGMGFTGTNSGLVLDNTIYNHKNSNIVVGSGANVSNLQMNWNNIYNESTDDGINAVINGSTSTLDAVNNYWGSTAGPWHPTKNPTGETLSSVTNYVSFEPWLSSPQALTRPVGSDPMPQNGSITNDAFAAVSIKIFDPQLIDTDSIVLRVLGTDYPFPSHLTFEGGSITEAGTLKFRPSPGPFPEGEVVVRLVAASDRLGNILSEEVEWSFIVDTTSPEITAFSLPSIMNAGTISISLNFFDNLSGVNSNEAPTVMLRSSSGAPISTFMTVFTGATWEGIATIEGGSPNGPATLEVSGVKDVAGNSFASLEVATCFIDTVPPTAVLANPNEFSLTLIGGVPYEIKWDSSDPDPSGGMPANPVSLFYSPIGVDPYSAITAETENDGSFLWNVPVITSANCRVRVTTYDSAGNYISAEGILFSIDSQNPVVVSTSPTNGASGVPVYGQIEIAFSDPMSTESVENAFDASPSIEGTFNWLLNDRILRFSITSNLLPSTTFVVTVGASSTDKDGFPLLDGDYMFSFLTSPPDASSPAIGPVYLNDRLYIAGVQDGMANAPTIRALITDEGGSGVDPSRFRIRMDGKLFAPDPSNYALLTKYLSFKVPEPDKLDIGNYVLTIEASDRNGNTSTWEGTVLVRRGPIIDQVKFGGRSYVAGDIISDVTIITARITVEVGNSIEISSIIIDMGPYDIVGLATYDPVLSIMTCDLNPTTQLGPASYAVSIEAQDIYGSKGYWAGFNLNVLAGSVQMLGPVLTYPTPFRPLTGTHARIAYTLSRDADITVFIYDISGGVVLTRKFRGGVNGGRAGYNDIDWDGRTDLGNIIGNGMYIYRITSGKKVVGTGKLVVLD